MRRKSQRDAGWSYRKIRLSTSVLILLGTFGVFQLIAQGLGFWAIRGMRSDIMHLSDLAIKQTTALDSSVRDLMDARINLARAATRMARGGAEPAEIVAHARQQLAQADKDFGRFMREASVDAQSRSASNSLIERFRLLRAALGDLVDFLDANKLQPYLDQPTQGYQDAFLREAQRYADSISVDADVSLASVDLHYVRFRIVGFSLLTAILVAFALASIALKRAIAKPLEQTEALFRSIAGGRLDNPIAVTGFREITQLQAGLGTMQSSLAEIVASVREAADFIHTGANRIALGNSEIASRTDNQASSLQQTAASMDELTAMVGQTAEHALEARRFAAAALREAQEGNDVVSTVVTQMNEMAQSAHRIGQITAVIDGIAFQTNILALNAAVEAARASEQGRGFAVVASEVRALAQRTAVAAKEIKQLIDGSVSRAQQGVALVERAKVAIGTVSESISRVAAMVGEISGASVEQSAGIEQMNQAIGEMDGMTTQNATLVERAAQAAKDLNEQTSRLVSVVATFRLG